MKVSFLDGPSLTAKLPELMTSCNQLDLAMAYVKIGGLRTLLKNANTLIEQGTPVRIVFGLSSRQGITDKKSAEALLKLSKTKNVVVKKWNSSGFHPKMFIFHGDHPCIAVGSANLTEAAQSTNAEANILVEDASPHLFQDTLRFFEYYFKPAPLLKRRDVDKYKPKIPGRTGGVGERTKIDDLPSPLQRKHDLENMRPRKIWKISPGRDACYWDEWLNLIDDDGEGFVAIGWNDVGNLKKFKSHNSLRNAVSRTARTVWDVNSDGKTKVKYVTDQLWTFKTSVSRGDIFIVYSETRVFGVAEVTARSTYLYWGTKELSFGHQIRVKYLWYKARPRRADDEIVQALGKQGTLLLVKEEWLWNHLSKRLTGRSIENEFVQEVIINWIKKNTQPAKIIRLLLRRGNRWIYPKDVSRIYPEIKDPSTVMYDLTQRGSEEYYLRRPRYYPRSLSVEPFLEYNERKGYRIKPKLFDVITRAVTKLT